MEKYICDNIFIPLRSGPTHKSEMLSQILFGEKYIITDSAGKWRKIESLFDGYQGWIDTDHVRQLPDKGDSKGFVLNRNLTCVRDDGTVMVLEPGCEIYEPDFEAVSFLAGEKTYKVTDGFDNSYVSPRGTPADTASRLINSPYIWGGRIPSGIDCSGLTQLVYKIHGIKIPRDSWKQADAGHSVDFLNESKPGDLVFFDNERSQITHVGMILSEGLVIHASGRVRIDRIDHQGIFRQETGKYSHHLRLIKRIVS